MADNPIKNEKDLLFGCIIQNNGKQMSHAILLLHRQIYQLRFIHVLLYLSRKKGIRAIHLKEALFNIATKTTIFVEKNVITCNIAVTKYQ